MGKLYHDDALVFGPAFLEAYDLERKGAKYPRVLLSDKTLAIANENGLKFGGYAVEHRAHVFARQDADGLHYVDFLSMAAAGPESVAQVPRARLPPLIIAAMTQAQQERDNNAQRPDVRANFGWLVSHIEHFLAEHGDLDVRIQ